MQKTSILFLLLAATTTVLAQQASTVGKDPTTTEIWTKPKKVAPGAVIGEAPSDAIVLFDGKDLSKWTTLDGTAAPKWDVKDGAFTVVKGTGDIKTKQTFGDIQLHIEWREPADITGESQGRGNSGIFFQERYELQVLESFEGVTYSNGQAGSIYKQHVPLVNATKKQGEWQAYDVVYNAPRFSDSGSLIAPGRITVFLNGVVVQNNSSIWGQTAYIGSPVYEAHGKASLRIQDHGNPVSFRNVWIREL